MRERGEGRGREGGRKGEQDKGREGERERGGWEGGKELYMEQTAALGALPMHRSTSNTCGWMARAAESLTRMPRKRVQSGSCACKSRKRSRTAGLRNRHIHIVKYSRGPVYLGGVGIQGCNHQPTELPSICCCHVKFILVQSSGICAYNHEILQMELGLFKFILVSSCPCTLPSPFINSHSEYTATATATATAMRDV